ncbi:class I SAM-dependent methyltransferase [Nibrella viscosa]|uniref:Class I SAM-dependent methyltransferase n=1 Tax=Nibrella viscosa TaxID=1084524 RepID=A0ABP8KL22_9BACT
MKALLIRIFGKERLYKVRKSYAVNLLPRIWHASRSYNYRYGQILQWALQSREDTNFTYPLPEDNILYLACTINVVTNTPVDQVVAYIREAQTDDTLKEHIINKIKQSPYKLVADERVEFGRRLGWYALVRILKPGVIIETGVDKGMGSVLLCSALLRNGQEGHPGQYYGTDINPRAGYLLDGPYQEVGKILYGDSIESLRALDAQIDLFINDSDHSADYEYREYDTIYPKLSSKAVLLGDNAHITSKLASFSVEKGRRFLFYQEVPAAHWYPGAGIGFSFV